MPKVMVFEEVGKGRSYGYGSSTVPSFVTTLGAPTGIIHRVTFETTYPPYMDMPQFAGSAV